MLAKPSSLVRRVPRYCLSNIQQRIGIFPFFIVNLLVLCWDLVCFLGGWQHCCLVYAYHQYPWYCILLLIILYISAFQKKKKGCPNLACQRLTVLGDEKPELDVTVDSLLAVEDIVDNS